MQRFTINIDYFYLLHFLSFYFYKLFQQIQNEVIKIINNMGVADAPWFYI